MAVVNEFLSNVNLGQFLEAIGKAMQQPVPAAGELRIEYAMLNNVVYDYAAGTLDLRVDSAVNLSGVVVPMGNGQSVQFPALVIAGLKLKCRMTPTVRGDTYVLFDVIKDAEATPPEVPELAKTLTPERLANVLTWYCQACGGHGCHRIGCKAK